LVGYLGTRQPQTINVHLDQPLFPK
jgi:hypothetical protein